MQEVKKLTSGDLANKQFEVKLIESDLDTHLIKSVEDYASWAMSNGKDWKLQLSNDWYYAGERTFYKGEWCYLQQLRNQYGWQWLENVKFEAKEV